MYFNNRQTGLAVVATLVIVNLLDTPLQSSKSTEWALDYVEYRMLEWVK